MFANVMVRCRLLAFVSGAFLEVSLFPPQYPVPGAGTLATPPEHGLYSSTLSFSPNT